MYVPQKQLKTKNTSSAWGTNFANYLNGNGPSREGSPFRTDSDNFQHSAIYTKSQQKNAPQKIIQPATDTGSVNSIRTPSNYSGDDEYGTRA